MTRRPTPDHVALNAIAPRGYEGYWSIIRRLDILGPWTVTEVARETQALQENVHEYIRRLARAKIAKVVEERASHPGAFAQKVYRLESRPTLAPRVRKDGSVCPPTAQDQMWVALRQIGSFSCAELAHFASTDDVSVDRAAAESYVSLLNKAGYLQVLQEGRGRETASRYMLKPSMNTGPLAPKVMRTKVVWDRNKSCQMGMSELEEVCS